MDEWKIGSLNTWTGEPLAQVLTWTNLIFYWDLWQATIFLSSKLARLCVSPHWIIISGNEYFSHFTFQSTFYLMFVGLGLSLITFVGELMLSRWHLLHDTPPISKYKDLTKLIVQAKFNVKGPVKALKIDVRMRKKKGNKKCVKQPPFPYIE